MSSPVLLATTGKDLFDKRPDEAKNYRINWARRLASDPTDPAAVIVASTFDPDPGITVDLSTFTDTNTTVFISGGARGETYEVVNWITKSNDVVEAHPIYIRIREN